MNDRYTPTSAFVAVLPREAIYSVPVRPANVTVGSSRPGGYYLHPRVTEQASEILPRISDKRMADTTKDLIDAIEETTYAFVAGGRDIEALPPVRATIPEDGSVFLEWTTPDFRLGFTIELDPNDSGWYVVTSKRLGEIGAYGLLSAVNSRSLVSFVVNFALANS